MPLRLQGRNDRFWRFLAIAIVLVIVVLFYADEKAFENDTREFDAARELQQQHDRLMASITAAETAQRGYLLTGNPVYLTSYKDAAGEVPRELDELERVVSRTPHIAKGPSHNSAEKKQIELMRTLAGEKFREMQQSIDVRDQQGADAALALVRTDEGRITMEQLRSAGKVLVSGEYLGLYQYRKDSTRDSSNSRIIVLVGSLGLIILLLRMGSSIDSVVTEREGLATKIEEARHLLETTLASIGDAVIVTNARGGIRFMNPVAENLTGWTMQLANERSLGEIFTAEDETTGRVLEDPFRTLQQSARQDEDLSKMVLISKDGARTPIENTSAPIRDAASRILGLVLVFRDVTARRSAERDLKRWKETFSNAGFGMFLADSKTGKIIDLNPTFASMHGYSVNELLGIGLHA